MSPSKKTLRTIDVLKVARVPVIRQVVGPLNGIHPRTSGTLLRNVCSDPSCVFRILQHKHHKFLRTHCKMQRRVHRLYPLIWLRHNKLPHILCRVQYNVPSWQHPFHANIQLRSGRIQLHTLSMHRYRTEIFRDSFVLHLSVKQLIIKVLIAPFVIHIRFPCFSQPLAVGAWCTLCLLAAAIMLPMIPLQADEVIAMGQHVVQARKKGERFWRVFWKGGQPIEMNKDERSPKLIEFANSPWKIVKASLWGMTFPWTLVISATLGILLMALPGLFGVDIKATAADIGHLGGALIVVVAIISTGEVVRIARYLNILLGLAVATLPWLLPDLNIGLATTSAITGLLVSALSIPRGPKTETYGIWDRYVR